MNESAKSCLSPFSLLSLAFPLLYFLFLRFSRLRANVLTGRYHYLGQANLRCLMCFVALSALSAWASSSQTSVWSCASGRISIQASLPAASSCVMMEFSQLPVRSFHQPNCLSGDSISSKPFPCVIDSISVLGCYLCHLCSRQTTSLFRTRFCINVCRFF